VSEDQPAPFIPPHVEDETSVAPIGRVFGTREYFRLWIAQAVSSIGDWIGFLAILSIVSRISDSAAAVSLVMLARVVPGFFLATIGGVLIDRVDRRKVMVFCDLGRAGLLALLPFVETVLGLVLISLGMEILTLLWGPAKDASVPNLVNKEHLTSVNTMTLIATFGSIPVATILFSSFAALASFLGDFDALSGLDLDQEALALYVDAISFLVCAAIVWRLPIPHGHTTQKKRLPWSPSAGDDSSSGGRQSRPLRRVDWLQTVHEIQEGLKFIAGHPRVRGVILGLAVGLVGAGAMVPLGPVFAREGLGGDSATFGVLMTALGLGAAVGVIALLTFQRRLPRETVFEFAVMGTGLFLILGVAFSSLGPSAFAIAFVGACAGTSYVTGFTTLQERVHDELRGRTFATLYTVIRLCLFLSLVMSPLFADLFEWIVEQVADNPSVRIGDSKYTFAGSRLALWGGGLLTLIGGLWARHSVIRAERRAAEAT